MQFASIFRWNYNIATKVHNLGLGHLSVANPLDSPQQLDLISRPALLRIFDHPEVPDQLPPLLLILGEL